MVTIHTSIVQQNPSDVDTLWNGEQGAGGLSWVERSRMGPLRGVIDAADETGRRNAYMHTLHTLALERELRRVAPLGRTLDFGCGTGRFLKTLSEYSNETYAIDREPAMVEAARFYAQQFVKRIECWSSDRTPYQAAYFDFVLCSSVLCVTTSDLFDRSLREMARILRSGGTLLMLEQVADSRGLSLNRYIRALAQAGCEVVRAYPIRTGRSFLTVQAGIRKWLPVSLFAALARIELALTARRANAPTPKSYVEYLFVSCRR